MTTNTQVIAAQIILSNTTILVHVAMWGNQAAVHSVMDDDWWPEWL